MTGDRQDVFFRLERHVTLAGKPFGQGGRSGIIGRRGQAQVAKPLHEFRRNFANSGMALSGSKGFASPRSPAVPGMN